MSLLDLRGLPLRERHRPVFAAFDGLTLGEHLELCDARDLESLQQLMAAARAGCFEWRPLQAADGEWRVQLSKQMHARMCDACPCACGGARKACELDA